MANNKTKYDPARRHRQNMRTFASVQKRREIHAKNHGVTIETLGARRWISQPQSKSSSK
jgi:hypothetical protein